MDLGLNGKVALVAAASRGLGRAVAAELAAEGAALVLCSRKAETINQTANEIAQATGTEVLALTADVSQSDDVVRLVRSGIERFGRIDILVTNSGGPPPDNSRVSARNIGKRRRVCCFSVPSNWRATFARHERARLGSHLKHHFDRCEAAGGNLILSNSLRAAVTGFARTLANEVAPLGITVNNIMPGYTRTERVEELSRMMADKEGISPAEFVARWEKEIPMRRLGEPHEFAAWLLFWFPNAQLCHRDFDPG